MHVKAMRWQENECELREDQLTVEEPFEVRIDQRRLAVIMRTPGHDHELAMGFLFTERVISQADDVLALEDASDADGLPLANIVNVVPRPRESQEAVGTGGTSLPADEHAVPDVQQRGQDGFAPVPIQAAAFERHFTVSASCGLCGRDSIADLMRVAAPLPQDELRIPASVIYTLPNRLRAAQTVFAHTGGLHAAGLFDESGELLLVREDVGRHNAVDKLIGHGLLHSTFPYPRHILMVSGRTSFEIISKALLARIPCVAAISAPSSLALDLADQASITLIGFLRDHSMNVYTHAERIVQ